MTKVKKRAAFEISDQRVAAGTRLTFDLKVPDLYIHADLSVPIHVIHGKKDGPVLFLSGAIHGDEILGVEIIRRVLTSRRLTRIRGTLVAAPVVNVFGFLNQSRYLPDRRDLNRSFPGSEKGSIAGRLANVFINEVVSRSDYGIDLHTAAIHRENLPQVRADTSNETIRGMAEAFGLPIIIDSQMIDGTLRQAAFEQDVLVITYEAGEALRFDETGIRAGARGVLKVMEHLDMLPSRRNRAVTTAAEKKKHRVTPVISRSSRWIRAPQSGIHRAVVPMGTNVKTSDVLGYLTNPIGENEVPVLSSTSGIVIGRSTLPLITEGEALFHIATFDEPDAAIAKQIDHVEASLEVMSEELQIDEPPIV